MFKIPKILIVVTLLIVEQDCSGQTKTLQLPMDDTSLWKTWQLKEIKLIGLSDLTKSKENLHFRFSSETQVIDIWTIDYKTYYGTFANFTTRYDEQEYKEDVKKRQKFYSKTVKIDTGKAKKIYDIFHNLSVFSIASDISISGWKKGDDGITYTIEHSTLNTYSFKNYWTPDYYKKEIKEAATIDTLVTELDKILQMPESFNAFIQTLPFGCYHAGSILLTCRESKARNKSQ